jgi:hypothetical protein
MRGSTIVLPAAMTLSADKIVELHVKQLEMVQAIIARLANYGATLKNYCITLTTAIFGFAITLQRPVVTLLAMLPVVVFAGLDVQFLRTERRFRALFDELSQQNWDTRPSFTINLSSTPTISYLSVVCSWSIIIFYLPLAFAIIAVLFFLEKVHGLNFW